MNIQNLQNFNHPNPWALDANGYNPYQQFCQQFGMPPSGVPFLFDQPSGTCMCHASPMLCPNPVQHNSNFDGLCDPTVLNKWENCVSPEDLRRLADWHETHSKMLKHAANLMKPPKSGAGKSVCNCRCSSLCNNVVVVNHDALGRGGGGGLRPP